MGDLAMPAGEEWLGGIIKRPQQAALPAGPYARPDRPDIAGGEDHQQGQALGRLHDVGKGLGSFGVLDIARLGDLAHQQVIFDEPGNGVGFRR
ncbi:hypothetical protein D3C71_1817830 [compost metagenome]